MSAHNPVEEFGFTAVPRSLKKQLSHTSQTNNKPLLVEDLPLPHSSNVAKQAHDYVKANLPPQTYNHSIRAFLWGMTTLLRLWCSGVLTSLIGSALLESHLPDLTASSNSSSWVETFYLACLLHDIGTTPINLRASLMSFETYGGFLALKLLQEWGAPREQAESVCEAIVRHQDLGEAGEITSVGGLLHVVTLLDNIGGNVELLHPDTIDDVVTAHPRNGWTGCFAATVREEIELKPWSHSTAIENFAENVESNQVWPKYD